MATGRDRTTTTAHHRTAPRRTRLPTAPSHPRTPPRLLTSLALLPTLLPLLALLTACAAPAAPAAPPASTTPEAPPTPPAALCARLVTHWAREVLDTGTYGDYQSMGLSNGQYALLQDVVDAARPVLKRDGRAAAEQLIDREAGTRCAARYRDGTPTAEPWT
ncbi:hypothetical protein AB0D49_16645 [Streptomyces sp. NPDC048290]|uniref:hypothetical protein n=1 Tax=Streptomyces sp. NPDC048290 TaxID=3155811 RepID=UPI0034163FC5